MSPVPPPRGDDGTIVGVVRSDLSEMRKDVRNDLADVRKEIREGFAEMRRDYVPRAELNERFKGVEDDVRDLKDAAAETSRNRRRTMWALAGLGLTALGTISSTVIGIYALAHGH